MKTPELVEGTTEWCVNQLKQGKTVYLNNPAAYVLFEFIQSYYREITLKVVFTMDKTYFSPTI